MYVVGYDIKLQRGRQGGGIEFLNRFFTSIGTKRDDENDNDQHEDRIPRDVKPGARWHLFWY